MTPRVPRTARACQHCGEPFTPGQGHGQMSRRFCSPQCRGEATRQGKALAARKRVGECPGCKRVRPIKSKGHCSACYQAKFYRTAKQAVQYEPTEEELEAMIAEQMKCLPSWWPKNGERDTDDE